MVSKKDVITDDNPSYYGISVSHKRCTETMKDYESVQSPLPLPQEAVHQGVP